MKRSRVRSRTPSFDDGLRAVVQFVHWPVNGRALTSGAVAARADAHDESPMRVLDGPTFEPLCDPLHSDSSAAWQDRSRSSSAVSACWWAP